MFSTSVSRTYKFSYGHKLHDATVSDEENQKLYGKCCNNHGHNAVVEVTIEGSREHGMVINFHEMDDYVLPTIESWDHQNLSEHPDFKDEIATAETMAEILFNNVRKALEKKHPSLYLKKVKVWENDRSCVTYRA